MKKNKIVNWLMLLTILVGVFVTPTISVASEMNNNITTKQIVDKKKNEKKQVSVAKKTESKKTIGNDTEKNTTQNAISEKTFNSNDSPKLTIVENPEVVSVNQDGNKQVIAEEVDSDKIAQEMGFLDLETFEKIFESVKKQHEENQRRGVYIDEEGNIKSFSPLKARSAGDPGTVVQRLDGSVAGEMASMFLFKIGNDTFTGACYQHSLATPSNGTGMGSDGALDSGFSKRLGSALEWARANGQYGMGAIMAHIMVHEYGGAQPQYGLSNGVWNAWKNDATMQKFYRGEAIYPDSDLTAKVSFSNKVDMGTSNGGKHTSSETTVQLTGVSEAQLTVRNVAGIIHNGQSKPASPLTVKNGDKLKFEVSEQFVSGDKQDWDAELTIKYGKPGTVYRYKYEANPLGMQMIAVHFPAVGEKKASLVADVPFEPEEDEDGEVKVVKIDEITGERVPGVTFRLDFQGEDAPPSKELTTNLQGETLLLQVPAGLKVTATEIAVPVPYLLASEVGGSDTTTGTVGKGTVLTLTHKNTKMFSLDLDKGINYDGSFLSPDKAREYGVDFTQVKVGLFKNGAPVQWDDKKSISPKFKVKKETQATTSGNVEFNLDKDGNLSLRNLVWGTYEIRELTRADGTRNEPIAKIAVDANKASGADDDLGVPLLDLKSNPNGQEISGAKGLVNTLKTFGFYLEKSIVMTGSQQEGIDQPVGQDSMFTDGTHSAIKENKVDMTKATFELQKKDGTPVKWSDITMKMFDGNKDVLKGSVAKTQTSVQFHPDKDGQLEVHALITQENEFQLVEVETPDRTNLDSVVIPINTEAPVYGQHPYSTENYDNTLTGTSGFLNNIDYTGIRLVKKGNYLGTIFGHDGMEYDAPTHTLGNSHFAGAEYTLYNGETDEPVKIGDYIIEKMTTGTWHGAKTTVSTSGNVVFTVQSNGLVAIIDNIIYGSYYIQETKAATGMHLDTKRYYFGDEPKSLPEDAEYLTPENKNADSNGIGSTNSGSKDISASKESTGITIDDQKLISAELEKRTKFLHTDSPFQTSERGEWGSTTGDVIYKHGDIATDYIHDRLLFGDAQVNNIGKTTREGAVYGLFYAADTIDEEGIKGEPVKLNHRVVEHMEVTSGTPITTDYVTGTGVEVNGTTDVIIATNSEAKLSIKNIAYATYYWKELEAPEGLAIDSKEYIFGANCDQKEPYVGSEDVTVSLDDHETQTNKEPSKTDTEANHHFNNTFSDLENPYGSTDTVLTFGFSSFKLAEYDAESVQNDGENGVLMTLTPIDGTLGDVISTKTQRMLVKDNSGKVEHRDGWFEFRTVPYGRYYLESHGLAEKLIPKSNLTLKDMKPIFVDLSRDEDKLNYTLTFKLDMNESKNYDQGVVIRQYKSSEGDYVPTQSMLDALKTNDEIQDGYGPGKNDDDVYEGEEHVWDRPDNKDVHSDGSKNNNFISAEVNLDHSGFDIVDFGITPEIGTTLTDDKGGKVISADGKVKLKDTITYKNMDSYVGQELTAEGVLTADGKPVLIDGKEITGSAKFTPEKANGTVEVWFEFDVSKLDTKTIKKLVAFETVLDAEGNIVAEHKDPDDPGQTVEIEPNKPEIGTTLTDDKDGKVISADGKVKLKDTITYKNMDSYIGQELTAEGVLTADGKPVLIDGKEITGSAKFTPEKANGTVEVWFEFDVSKLDAKTIKKLVAFETVLDTEGNVVAEHKDPDDPAQTVTFEGNPEIDSQAHNGDGKSQTIDKGTNIDAYDIVTFDKLSKDQKYVYEYEIVRRVKEGNTVESTEEGTSASTSETSSSSNSKESTESTESSKESESTSSSTTDSSTTNSSREKIKSSTSETKDSGTTTESSSSETSSSKNEEATDSSTAESTEEESDSDIDEEENEDVDKEVVATGSFEFEADGESFEKEVSEKLDTSNDKDGDQYVYIGKLKDAKGNVVSEHEDLMNSKQTLTVKVPDPKTTIPEDTGKTLPQTGEMSAVSLMTIVALVSSTLIGCVVYFDMKKKKTENQK